jgi:hypothetical protein
LVGSRKLVVCVALLGALMVMAPMASAVTYTITVATDSSSYTTGQTIKVSGTVSPGPGPSTAVLLRICSSVCKSGTLLAVGEASADSTSGAYSFTFVAGGSSSWTTGTYTVNATWGASPPTIFKTTTFTYTVAVTTTSSSSSSSSSSSTSTSTSTSSSSSTTSSSTSTTSSTSSSSTTSSSSSSSSSSTSAAVPEFPLQASFAAVFVAVVVVAYLLAKRGPPRVSASLTKR